MPIKWWRRDVGRIRDQCHDDHPAFDQGIDGVAHHRMIEGNDRDPMIATDQAHEGLSRESEGSKTSTRIRSP
jgi:hypothetical protein